MPRGDVTLAEAAAASNTRTTWIRYLVTSANVTRVELTLVEVTAFTHVYHVVTGALRRGPSGQSGPRLTVLSVAMLVSVSVIKLGLFVLCYQWRHVSGSIRALAFDHVSDAVSNCVALLAAVMAGSQRSKDLFGPGVWMADPIGGGDLLKDSLTCSSLQMLLNHTTSTVNSIYTLCVNFNFSVILTGPSTQRCVRGYVGERSLPTHFV